MSTTKVNVNFSKEFEGTLDYGRGQVRIGKGEGEAKPYELLLGALAACFYATFLDVIKKKRISYDGVKFEVTGVKREEIPTTLKTVDLDVTIEGAEAGKERAFQQAAELARKYCSVYQTLSEVAQMNVKLTLLE